jgi:ParB family transcriptional regulator, chromosome partitioning protein
MSKSKHAVEAPRVNLFLLDPEQVVLVEDVASAIYDERIKLPLNEALVLNVIQYGVLEPILVRKNAETGEVECVDGRQRVKAAREANKRLKKQGSELIKIPALFKRGEPHTLMGAMISSFIREDDTAEGKAKKLARYLDLGRSNEEAAVTFGMSVATVKNLLALNDAPKNVRAAVQSGKITVSQGYKMARLEPAEAKARLAKLEKLPAKTEKVSKKQKAKKVREVLSGGAMEMRTRVEIDEMRQAVSDSLICPGETQRLFEALFSWVMGADGTMDEFLRETKEAAEG